MTPDHKWLDFIQHLWPYISGLFLAIITMIRIWWVHWKRLFVIEDTMATKADLHECRAGVDRQDADNLESVMCEIKELRADIKKDSDENIKQRQNYALANSQQHQDILKQMTILHSND